jgi:hypothetical protein
LPPFTLPPVRVSKIRYFAVTVSCSFRPRN